jgi:PPP family 3-phenylpropionic acid transporter
MSLRALGRGPGLTTAGVFAALFLAFGAQMPFWPLWLRQWGLSEGEVGLFLGAAVVARVLGGVLAPWLADLTGRRRTALALTAAAGAAAFAAHPWVGTRGALFALTLLWAMAFSASVPIADALAGAAAERHGFAYAQARAVGSAAFLLANLLCGAAVAFWGVDAALWWIVASLLAAAAVAARHPGGVRDGQPRARPAEALGLMRSRPFALAALATATLQASHGPLYAYGSIHWRAQGLDEAAIGALWATGVATEVAVMAAFGARLTRRLGPAGLFALSGAVCAARWAAMTLEPAGSALWAWQASHALTFVPAHLGLIAYVGAAVPPRLAASAQGLMGGAGSVAMAAATFAAAALYPAFGAGMYWFGFALAAAGLAAGLALARDAGRTS